MQVNPIITTSDIFSLERTHLVGSLEGWYGLALVLVQGLGDNFSERQINLAVLGIRHQRQRVLHPLLIAKKSHRSAHLQN